MGRDADSAEGFVLVACALALTRGALELECEVLELEAGALLAADQLGDGALQLVLLSLQRLWQGGRCKSRTKRWEFLRDD